MDLDAYTLVFAAFMNPAGRLGDRYGHCRIFLCGLRCSHWAPPRAGFPDPFGMLVVSRAVQALGAAMLMPSSLALLLAAFPASRRATAVSTWSAVGAMAAALGPPVGGCWSSCPGGGSFSSMSRSDCWPLQPDPWVLVKTLGAGAGIPDLFGALSLVFGVGAPVWALIDLPAASWHAAKVVVPGIGAVDARSR